MKIRWTSAGVSAAVLLAGLAGTALEAQAAEITIGFVNPQTGPFSALGKAARHGIDLALEGAKQNPALKGVSFKVVERDSAAKVSDAMRHARELSKSVGVDVLMGGLSSAECLSLQQFAGENELVYLVASGCWVDDFSAASRANAYSFRVNPNNKQRNVAFVSWLNKNLAKNWFVLYTDTAYGQSGLQAFQGAGGNVVGSLGIPFGATDMAAYVSKVDRKADGIYYIFAGRDATLALQETLSQGLSQKMKLAGLQSLVIPEAFPKLPASAEGLTNIGAYPRDINGPVDTPANRAFRARWKAFFGPGTGDVVESNAFEAYVSTNALLRAIATSGFRSRGDAKKLIKALEELNEPASVDFPSGPVVVRKADHQGAMPLYVSVIRNGTENVQQAITTAEIEQIK
jgi:ABC-type branched-subunit amino acid transport system substrate-binding protein